MSVRPTKKPDMWLHLNAQASKETPNIRRAWELRQGESEKLAPTWIGAYLLECPHLHAFWSYWIVSVVHLRDHEGVAPAIITNAGATHELSVLAVEPSSTLDPDEFGSIRYMMPPDVVEQFGPTTDAQALFVLENSVNACVRAQLHPDVDFRRLWAPAVEGFVNAAQVIG